MHHGSPRSPSRVPDKPPPVTRPSRVLLRAGGSSAGDQRPWRTPPAPPTVLAAGDPGPRQNQERWRPHMDPELYLIAYHTREHELAIDAEHRLACIARPQSTRPTPRRRL